MDCDRISKKVGPLINISKPQEKNALIQKSYIWNMFMIQKVLVFILKLHILVNSCAIMDIEVAEVIDISQIHPH